MGFVFPLNKPAGNAGGTAHSKRSQESGEVAKNERGAADVLASGQDLDFSGLAPERQLEALIKMSEHFEIRPLQDDVLHLAEALKGLSFERGMELLSQMRASDAFRSFRTGSDMVRTLLVERIAGTNPESALGAAQKNDDRILLGAALDAMAQKNAAEAVRAIARLPGRYQIMGIWFVRGLSSGEFSLGPQQLGGTLEETVGALKTNASLFLQSQFGGQLRGLMAGLAAKDAEDPAVAVFKLRAAMRDLFRSQQGVDAKKADSLVTQRIGEFAASMQFSGVSDEPFAIYNALKETERNDAVAGRVMSRLVRESGLEAAMRFAGERRVNHIPKELALRAFLAVSREDPRAGLQWIETLPAGPLRQGVLLAVAYAAIADATTVDPDAGHAEALTDAGMRLFSDKTKTDYFLTLITGDGAHSGGLPRSMRNSALLLDVPRPVFIEELPIPEDQKLDLWKQSAPIRAK